MCGKSCRVFQKRQHRGPIELLFRESDNGSPHGLQLMAAADVKGAVAWLKANAR